MPNVAATYSVIFERRLNDIAVLGDTTIQTLRTRLCHLAMSGVTRYCGTGVDAHGADAGVSTL
jgi:hypothetical protein